MDKPLRLVDWPLVEVKVDCTLCTRRGCYRLARLAARYGAGLELNAFLIELGRSCPFWNERPRNYEPRCGIRLTDCDDGPPRLERPKAEPSRRNVPMRPQRVLTIPDLIGSTVTIVCDRCRRRGVYRVSTLLQRFGAELSLPTVLGELAGTCPGALESTPRCGAVFENLRTRP